MEVRGWVAGKPLPPYVGCAIGKLGMTPEAWGISIAGGAKLGDRGGANPVDGEGTYPGDGV